MRTVQDDLEFAPTWALAPPIHMLASTTFARRERTLSSLVGIIGAGPAGLAAAYSLAKLGVSVEVFEAGPAVGGMARTIDLWGQKVDLGPHRFFSSNDRVNRLWLEAVGRDYRMVDRTSRIYYDGEFFEYPLQLVDSLAKMGTVESFLCVLSYLRQQFRRSGAAEDSETWLQRRFGRRLYENLFRTYSEKVWGIPCSRLDAEFATQRIRGFSLSEAVSKALLSRRDSQHPTLVERFAYPLGGAGSPYVAMAEEVRARAGSVHLRSPVTRVSPREDGLLELELASGRHHVFPNIVSSMPLTHLVKALPEAPSRARDAASALRFRNTILVYLRIAAQDLFPDQWLYIHESELEVGRITNYRNWVPELHGESTDTILSLEIWCDPGDARWREADDRLVDLATRDLRETGLIDGAEVIGGHVIRVPYCYPVYELGYRDNLTILKGCLAAIPGLQAIGRYGAFKYNNQDHCLLMGMLAAENIALARTHDLWEVNTETVYQEATTIGETGLVPKPA